MFGFQIVTRGMPSRPDEWFHALNTPVSELPSLTDEDKRSARVRQMTDEQYARHLLLVAVTRKREEKEAEELGRTIAELLLELGGNFNLRAIGKRALEPGWYALIEPGPDRPAIGTPRYVPFPTEDFSDGQNGEVLNIGDVARIRDRLISELDIETPLKVAS